MAKIVALDWSDVFHEHAKMDMPRLSLVFCYICPLTSRSACYLGDLVIGSSQNLSETRSE